MRGLLTVVKNAIFLGFGLALATGIARAQEGSSGNGTDVRVNYVYASQLGIGTYDVGGLSVDVYTLPLGFDWNFGRDLDLEAPVRESRDWALEFNFPVSYGRFDLNGTNQKGQSADISQQVLAIVPGLALRAPISDNWRLKPFVNFGYGNIVSTEGTTFTPETGTTSVSQPDNRSFIIYSAGVSSLYEIPFGLYTFALGNGVTFAGNTELGSDAFSENYWAIETGLELRRSLGFRLGQAGLSHTGIAGLEPELGGYFIHYFFPDPLKFGSIDGNTLEVMNQFEFGVTLGSATDWELLSIRNPKIGASYIFGDDLTVFRVNFGFPF